MDEMNKDGKSVESFDSNEPVIEGKKKSGTSGLAVAGLVVGIVAIIGSWVPFLNLASAWIAIVAIGLSVAGLIISIKGTKGGKGVAIAGLVLGVVTIILVVAMYGGAAAVSDDASKDSSSSNSSTQTEAAEEKAAKDDSGVVIGSAELGKDYEGKKTVIVDYEWTNNSDEAASLIWTYSIKAFQNGVELKESIFSEDWLTEDEKSDWTDSSKEVKPGATIKTSIAYELDDESALVEIEVTGIWSDDVLVSKTIEIKK